jgi:hypothetical protein
MKFRNWRMMSAQTRAIHFPISDELSFSPPFLKFSAADSFRSASRSCQKVDTCPALSLDFVRDPCHRVRRGVHDICGCFTISAIFFIVEFLIVYGSSVAKLAERLTCNERVLGSNYGWGL